MKILILDINSRKSINNLHLNYDNYILVGCQYLGNKIIILFNDLKCDLINGFGILIQ